MNILLRDFMRDGVMKHLCTPFSDADRREHMLRTRPGRTIMDMGPGVVPGPFWAVFDEDVPALEARGYEVSMRRSDIDPAPPG